MWAAIVAVRETALMTQRTRIFGTIYAFQNCQSWSTPMAATNVPGETVTRTTRTPAHYNDTFGEFVKES